MVKGWSAATAIGPPETVAAAMAQKKSDRIGCRTVARTRLSPAAVTGVAADCTAFAIEVLPLRRLFCRVLFPVSFCRS